MDIPAWILGGPPVTVIDFQNSLFGAGCGQTTASSLVQTARACIGKAGGEPEALTTPDTYEGVQIHALPSIIPVYAMRGSFSFLLVSVFQALPWEGFL